MKVRVHWESRYMQGSFDVNEPTRDYKEWMEELGAARSSGDGFFIGSKGSFPLKNIVRIENLEAE